MRVLPPTVVAAGGPGGGRRPLRARPAATRSTSTLDAPRELIGALDPGLTPFLPMAAVAAAAAGEDLELSGAVSPAVLAGARRNLATMAGWWGWRVPAHHRRARPRRRPADAGPRRRASSSRAASTAGRACSPCRPRAPGRPTCSRSATSSCPATPTRRPRCSPRPKRVADRLGLPLVELSTNARALLDPLEDWPRTHGAVLAGFALLLRPLLAARVRRRHPRARVAGCRGAATPTSIPHWSSETSSSCTTRPTSTAPRRSRSSPVSRPRSTRCSCAGRAAAPATAAAARSACAR